MAAAFDLSSGRDMFQFRAPDAPVVLNAADALAALCRAGAVGLIAACHVRELAARYYRMSEKRLAFPAFVTEKGETEGDWD